MIDAVLKTIDDTRVHSLDGLKELLRIPSVSAKPDHKGDCARCAEFLARRFTAIGFSSEVVPTKGHPIVLARNPHVAGRPTVLLYGHYDVQPPEPLAEWITPPFEPRVRKTEAGTDAVFARGAVDDKGQVWAHIHALEAWHRHGGVPVNLICLIEGEEEVSSENLTDYLKSAKDQLRADVAVISDTGQFARGMPALTYGLRGLCYMEVFLTGAAFDLHSGSFGGSVPNPANALVELLATLHDSQGKVSIPGFYDDVLALTSQERDEWNRLPFDEPGELKQLGLTQGIGEAGFGSIERRWARPTCDINGLTSGYQGAGAKTVIPARASAKVSMRLVPNQNPRKIQALFEKTMKDRCPAGVKIEIIQHGSAGPVLVPREGRFTTAAARALEIGFGKAPVFIREGGTIPVVDLIKSVLGMDTLLIGFGLSDDRTHSPNEKFELPALHGGARTAAALWAELARK